jgi:uncharacterized lipoprotein YmbA
MRHRTIVVALLGLLPACLGPRTETSRYYTLPPDRPLAVASATPVASLGLEPVTLPPYLSRPEFATRLGPERIAYSANDRWAGPLDEMVTRALAEDLRAGLGAREVVRWPWPLGAAPEVSASVDFLRFEADSDGGATLEARWTVSARGQAPVPGETRVKEAGAPGDVAASVAALGRALRLLASDLAAAAKVNRGG